MAPALLPGLRMKTRALGLLAMLLLAGSTGCVGGDDEIDGIDDPFTLDGKADGAADGRVVLAMANRATHAQLVEAGLAESTIRSIEGARAGADRRFATADDVAIASVEDLDALPYVGPVAFAKLLAYAERAGGRHGYLPRGAVDLETLVTLDVVTEEAGPGSVTQPLQTAGADDNEQVLCHLTGDNPGPVNITCRRDEAGGGRPIRATAVMNTDGTFEAVGTDDTATRFDQYLRVAGRVQARKLTIDDYEFLRLQRCPPFGVCNPQVIFRVLRHVKLPGAQSGPLGSDCRDDEGPVLTTVTVPAGFTIDQQCGTCYQRQNVCVAGISEAATLTCLHTRIEQPLTSTAGCAEHLEPLGSYQCNSSPTRYLCEGVGDHNPVPDDEATVLARTCPAGFRAIAECGDRDVCLDERIDHHQVTNGSPCLAGLHYAMQYSCPFVDRTVCVED